MINSRIKNLLLEINNSPTNLFFLAGNTEDIFCNKNLLITNLKLELYNSFKNISKLERITFIEKDNIYFLDEKSYKSYLGSESTQLTAGPLGNIKLLNSKINSDYMQKVFKEAFIDQLDYFLNQDIKSVYILDTYSFNNYFYNYDYSANPNNLFIIINHQLNNLNFNMLDKNNFKIIEIKKPDKYEITNLLNNLRINNNLETIYNPDQLIEKIDSLAYIYNNLKDYHNICLDLENIFVKKEIIYKDNTDWLEL